MKSLSYFLILIILISCVKPEKNPLDKLAVLDVKLSVPKEGEWMAEHEEDAQTFEKYCAGKPISIEDDCNIIYIQPIGIFTSFEKKIVDDTVDYISKFFQ